MRLVLLAAVLTFLARGRPQLRNVVRGVVRVSRVVADLVRAEAFYRDGLGFQRVSAGRCDPALSAVLGRADRDVPGHRPFRPGSPAHGPEHPVLPAARPPCRGTVGQPWRRVVSHMDGLDQAHTRVTGLRPLDDGSMGLELLCYDPPSRLAGQWPANDGVTDWVTLLVPGLTLPRLVQDPDGHRMLLVGRTGGLA